MRKLIPLIAAFLLAGNTCSAQYVNIPDSIFRETLRYWYPSCMNAAGQLDTTCNDILSVEDLHLNLPLPDCSVTYHDLTGLQYFKNLKKLDISSNPCLEVFPLINSLKELHASHTPALKLSSLPNGLKIFNVSKSNELMGSFGAFINDNGHLPDSLEYLICTNTFPDVVPAFPAGLKYLDLSAEFTANIHSLPSLPPGLKYLSCKNLQLSSLPPLPSSLTYLNCSNSAWLGTLTELPELPPQLDTLECMGQMYLRQMPELPASLSYLSCTLSDTTTSFPAIQEGLKTFNLYAATSLTSLPPLPNSITDINFGNLGLSGILDLPDSLRNFVCNSTNITGFTGFPNKLAYISLAQNTSLASLPPLPAALRELSCTNAPLTAFPSFATAPAIKYLTLTNSLVTALPDDIPLSLKRLGCAGNRMLTTLPASARSVDTIFCVSNALTSLPVLSNAKVLVCGGNQLTHLPALPSIVDLDCQNNRLTELPDLPATLKLLVAFANPIHCLPRFPEFDNPGYPATILIDSTEVHCIPNTIVNGSVQHSTGPFSYDYYFFPGEVLGAPVHLPLCSPVNNVSNCQAFPVISGNIFYDLNSNGIKDAGEYSKEGAKIKLGNSNAFTFSNSSGYFEISANGTGNSSVSIDPPSFYNVVPPSSVYNFTSFDTIVSKAYALQPNRVIDSMTVSITPLNWAARPGFEFPCLVQYENIGTTTLNFSLSLSYDNTKLDYDSASVTAVNNGNTITLSQNNFQPGRRESFIAYFRVKPTTALGDTLFEKVIIIANGNIFSTSITASVRGAFDPNDKQATPQLSPSQVANGEYINYTIRFQNTGTDTAFNVVISDTLSEDLQTNTLQMITASHTCKATVKDNVVFFEFLNIFLPDSNVNEPKSHGFVSFRIKPQTTVAANATITNKAAIYFDYNAAVITNTAGTLIKEFTVVPLRLVSFSAVPQTDNTTTLYWNTTNEINTKQFVIEQSSDGLKFIPESTVAAKGKANNNYSATIADFTNGIAYYRLKIIDNDGSFSYSPILKVDKRKNTSGIAVMTNPVKDLLIINTNDRSLNNTPCGIINTQGAVVKNFIVKLGTQTFELKDLPAGVYYLRSVNSCQKILVK